MANTNFNFNIDPYYDDFEADAGAREQNYMRILFRPGYAVQARELTQLQTIIQNQIKQFGNHIFQDGSPVEGGHVTLDIRVKSIRLQPQYNAIDIDLEDFDGQLIRNADTNADPVRAQVVKVDNSQSTPVIIVKYMTGNEFAEDDEIEIVSSGIKATVFNSSAITEASVVSINEGVFYVGGFFVFVEPQTIILDTFGNSPNYRIGLEIEDGIKTETDDNALLDPAQGSFNYQAPGATRYQFALNLSKRSFTSTDDNRFFELLRVQNGVVTKQVVYPIYSELEKTLARRTFDESGHYTVKPFRTSIEENEDDANTYNLVVEAGKAYVKGFEFETLGAITLTGQKANTENTSTDYSFSLDYGNYVIASNVYGTSGNGFLDTANTTEIDLHCVPSGKINTASAGAYSNTKIGSARVRNIDFGGTTAAAGDNHLVYLFDVDVQPLTVNVATADNVSSANLPATFSDLDDAYKNVKVRINSGTGVDAYTRVITSYNAQYRTIFVDFPFSTQLDATSNLTFEYEFTDTDAMVVAPGNMIGVDNVYATRSIEKSGTSENAHKTCMDISFDGRTLDGKTILFDNDRKRLYYTLPQSYVSNTQFTDIEYYIKSSISGSSTIQDGPNYRSATINPEFGSWFFGTGTLSSTTAKNNFVVVKRNVSGGSANGEIVDFSVAPNAIIEVSSTSLTIRVANTSSETDFDLDIVATEKVSDATGPAAGKVLVSSNSYLLTTDAPSNGLGIRNPNGTVGSNVFVDVQNGHVWFSNTDSDWIVNTPGTKQSLYLTDVVRIIKILDSGSPSANPSNTVYTDITNRYLFNGGQKDDYYDYASITLKDGYNPPLGRMVVMVEFFYRNDDDTDFYNATSYGGAYANNKVPLYSSSGRTVNLVNVIDFRRHRTSATSYYPGNFKLSGPMIPSPEFSMTSTYNYFVPRVDSLVLTKDREFKIVQGIPKAFPIAPVINDDNMVLYNIRVPAGLANTAKFGLEYVENKRYTMRDIGAFDLRLERLEELTSLNSLEIAAQNETVLYEDNLTEKEKYGIVVDAFKNFSVADVRSPDLRCSIKNGVMGPAVKGVTLPLRLVSSTNATINDKTITLSYSETAAVTQSTVTKAITVQPYEFAGFDGRLRLYPDTDYFYSQVLLPDVITNDPDGNLSPLTNPNINPFLTGSTFAAISGGFGNGLTMDSFGTFDLTNWLGAFAFGGTTIGNVIIPSGDANTQIQQPIP